MKVSVVIPTFNRKQSLLRCLTSIGKDVEIVVVDDGSSDGTAEVVKQMSHPELVYVQQANGGPASARNKGIGIASGDYIAFTDDDCVAVEPWPWPPDGHFIAFTSQRDGNFEIYVMQVDGTCLTNLTNNPALDCCPTWSPWRAYATVYLFTALRARIA